MCIALGGGGGGATLGHFAPSGGRGVGCGWWGGVGGGGGGGGRQPWTILPPRVANRSKSGQRIRFDHLASSRIQPKFSSRELLIKQRRPSFFILGQNFRPEFRANRLCESKVIRR